MSFVLDRRTGRVSGNVKDKPNKVKPERPNKRTKSMFCRITDIKVLAKSNGSSAGLGHIWFVADFWATLVDAQAAKEGSVINREQFDVDLSFAGNRPVLVDDAGVMKRRCLDGRLVNPATATAADDTIGYAVETAVLADSDIAARIKGVAEWFAKQTTRAQEAVVYADGLTNLQIAGIAANRRAFMVTLRDTALADKRPWAAAIIQNNINNWDALTAAEKKTAILSEFTPHRNLLVVSQMTSEPQYEIDEVDSGNRRVSVITALGGSLPVIWEASV